jgi:diguanylate cyclase (GGDEF)-like protein/PAS domain S-box-containing protein
MYFVVVFFAAVVLGLLVVNHLCSRMLNSVRAYVAGEGLWSKGQKDASFYLSRYVSSHDEGDYAAFRRAIAIPLGDRQARLELNKALPDFQRVREGFIQGGNHPDDVEDMAAFYRRYRNIVYMRQAIEIWTEGDRQIQALLALSERLHANILAGAAVPATADDLRELETLNRRLLALENEFSGTLGTASRWVNSFTHILTYVIVALLLLLGLGLSMLIIRGIHRSERALFDSEARFRRVVDSNMIGIVFWREDGAILDANEAFLRMVGYSEADLKAGALSWRAMTPAEHAEKDRQALAVLARAQVCAPYEKELIRRDGSRIPVCIGAALYEGQRESGVCFVLDIGERKRMEAQLRLAARAIEESGKAIMITDAANRIVFANRAFTEITGYAADEVVGKNPRLLGSKQHSREFYAALWASLTARGRWEGEIIDRRKSGELYPQWLNISVVKDEHGETTHYVAVFSDITERKSLEDQIRHQAYHDGLTGLPNRVLLESRLDQSIGQAKRRGDGLALLFLDLDGFKAVNDTFGHHAGDQLLQAVAKRLRNRVRRSDDLVSRLGGDEFVVLLGGIRNPREILAVAKQLVGMIAAPYELDGRIITIGTSIGISLYPKDGGCAADLMSHADTAMYQAKRQGRNTCRLYEAP